MIRETIRHIWLFKSVRMSVGGIIIICIGVALLYSGGWYPAIRVDGTFISARTIRMSYTLTRNYYTAIAQQTNIGTLSDANIKKIVIDGLIDDVCITHELQSRLGNDIVQEKTITRVHDMIGTTETRTQAVTLTRMSEKETTRYFIEPMARQQILVAILETQNKNAMEWLITSRASARVSFLFFDGVWQGEKGYAEK